MRGLPVAAGVALAAGAGLAYLASNGYGMRSSQGPPAVVDRGLVPKPQVMLDTEPTSVVMGGSEDELSGPLPDSEGRVLNNSRPAPPVRVTSRRVRTTRNGSVRKSTREKPKSVAKMAGGRPVAPPPSIRIKPRSSSLPPSEVIRPSPRRGSDEGLEPPSHERELFPRPGMSKEERAELDRQLERDREWRRRIIQRWEEEERERARKERARRARDRRSASDDREEEAVTELAPADEVDRLSRDDT